MKIKNHYVYLLLFFFLAACGGAPNEGQAEEDLVEPDTEEAVTEPYGEIEELAREIAELTCEMMLLTEKLMHGDPEAEAKSEEVTQRLDALGKRVEALIDEDDIDEVTQWDLAFQRFWEKTDCN